MNDERNIRCTNLAGLRTVLLAIALASSSCGSAAAGETIALLCDQVYRANCTEAGCKEATSSAHYWRVHINTKTKTGTLEMCGSDIGCQPTEDVEVIIDSFNNIKAWYEPVNEVFSISPDRTKYADAYAAAQEHTFNSTVEFGKCQPLPPDDTPIEELFK